MIGIYKITSPSKRVYIGQSVNIQVRFTKYKSLNCKSQPILYNSFLKYGVDKHKFEIICECLESELNDFERYYQDLYSVLNGGGLNCILTKSSDRSGKHSKETIEKLRILSTGNKNNVGKRHTQETKEKIRLKKIGQKHSQEAKDKIKLSLLGNKHALGNDFSGVNNNFYGKNHSEKSKLKIKENNKKARKVIDTKTGIIYNSILEAALSSNINKITLRGMLVDRSPNRTSLTFY